MDELNVFYVTSNLYAPIAGVSITSLFMNNIDIDKISVYIFADEVSEENIRKFIELGVQFGREIIIIDAKKTLDRFDKLNMGKWRGSNVAYGKAFSVDFVPENVDRLIVIDSDTIVVNNLRPAMEYVFDENSVLAMAKEAVFAFLPKDSSRYGQYNSGFIIYNAKKWREEGWTDKLLWQIENVKSDYRVVDQDLLNIVCKGHIAQLLPEFNFLPIHRVFSDKVFFSKTNSDYYSRKEIEDARKCPIVIHMYRFLGAHPWQKDSPHPDRELFDKYLCSSLWKDYTKGHLNKGVMFQIERIMYKYLPERVFFNIFITVHKINDEKSNREDAKKSR